MYGYKAVLEAARRDDTYKKGLYLRPLEYIAIKGLLTQIGRALPELDGSYPVTCKVIT